MPTARHLFLPLIVTFAGVTFFSSDNPTVTAVSTKRSDRGTSAEQVEWIRASAVPLRTVEAGHGFDDMMPLKKIIGDARVVALGEALMAHASSSS